MKDHLRFADFPKTASFGGDVADLLETLREKETQKPYRGSMNPDGNPFARMSVQKMIQSFSEAHSGPHDLDILLGALDSFYGVEGDKKPDFLPAEYNEARQELEKLLQEKNQKSNAQIETK